jgi:Formylglycine-generating sulfatase enzyme.
VGGQAGTSTECPPSTRRVISLPANDHNTGASHGEPNTSTRAVCVDEYPVSEVDYAACVACEQPRLPRSKVKMRTRTHSEFCLTGRTPTVAPIQCTTWTQADAYCQSRAARLPSEDELRAAIDPTADAPMEWTHAAPKPGRERLGPFRCVSSE